MYSSISIILTLGFLIKLTQGAPSRFPEFVDDDSMLVDYDHDYLLSAKFQPRHVHLSYGENFTTEMVVTWSTVQELKVSPQVEFGIDSVTENMKEGTTTEFVEKSNLSLTQYIHRASMSPLIPGQKYIYRVGSSLGWSPLFFFTAMQAGQDWLPYLCVYGDLGNEKAVSLVPLQRETQAGMYDAIIHVGDFAYNMNHESGEIGDSFMEQIEVIAGYVAYMVCPGNHEQADNFHQYRNRFTMPGERFWHSWDMGPIHFISISTEVYYFPKYGLEQAVEQYQWLEKDLIRANRNRKIRPWIIIYGHRPMYCSNANTECDNLHNAIRIGLEEINGYGLENLLMEQGVDLCIWAHQHSYERFYPLYNLTVYNGSDSEPFRNPRALTHVVTGTAGCKWNHDSFSGKKPAWVVFRTTDYGYSRLKILSSTELYFEQVSVDKGGEVIDRMTLIRDKHVAYPFPKGRENYLDDDGRRRLWGRADPCINCL